MSRLVPGLAFPWTGGDGKCPGWPPVPQVVRPGAFGAEGEGERASYSDLQQRPTVCHRGRAQGWKRHCASWQLGVFIRGSRGPLCTCQQGSCGAVQMGSGELRRYRLAGCWGIALVNRTKVKWAQEPGTQSGYYSSSQ